MTDNTTNTIENTLQESEVTTTDNATDKTTNQTIEKPTTKPINPSHLAIAKWTTWLAYAGILGIIIWVNLTEETGSWARWGVQSIPLLLVLPGMLLKKYRAYSWLCFITVMYFIPCVMKVMDPRGDWLDALMLTLSIIIFLSAAFTSRWMQRQ